MSAAFLSGNPAVMLQKTRILAAFFASAMFVIMLGAAKSAASPLTRTAENWTPFDRLVMQSEKAMMADPGTALQRARAATEFAEHHRFSKRYAEAAATGWWLAAEALTRLNSIQAAREAADHAAKLARGDGKITKLDGDVELARARIASETGDIGLALKSLQKAYAIFVHVGNPRSQSQALQGLGSIYGKAHDFAREISYYRKASQIYSGDPALLLSAANNLGFALQQLGRYDESVANFRGALKIAQSLKSPFLEGTILTNLAFVYSKQQKLTDAEQAANYAMKVVKSVGDSESARFVWGVKAEIDYRKGALRAAATDLDNAFRGTNLKMTTAPFRDMHEIAYKVYRAEGNAPLSLAHLEAFKRLDDKGRSLVASANLALLGAQFDFATQQLEIEHLKSAQLKRDISLKESRAATQTILFLTLFAATLLVIAWIVWRHVLVHRHRDAISHKNTELLRTLGERDHEIARRTEIEAQLRLAMETALQANRAKNHFLANMSHELRTPLNAIIGFSELLITGPIAEKPREYARNIFEGGRHLLANLNDVLDMARIEAGRIALHEEVVALDDLMQSAVADVESNATAGKSIKVWRAGPAIALRCDRTRLRQVLINLLSNAVKFTGDRGKIEIRAEILPGGIGLIVQDDGPGIPEDKLDLILEPFGQAESAYARAHGGMGLGLPIVKSLVELHGGRFTLESAAGLGTIARVHLPRGRIVEARAVMATALAS
ncbi:MAG TPA: ATP-binding protein [Rhizomicrobium sp.]|jgi:signal transduction histidine kinase|nr:ATP-binding protein [Rhizomicrobium sp.]